MKKPPLRVHSEKLSLWQSLVKETTEKLYADNPEFVEKFLAANDAFVEKAAGIPGFPFDTAPLFEASYPENGTSFTNLSSDNLSALLEDQFVQWHLNNVGGLQLSTSTQYRKYSDDPWTTWVSEISTAYAEEYADHLGQRAYNTYNRNQISTFGVIDWEIPRGSKVGIIGDWGTGMEDAQYLLKDLLLNHNPAVLIHLGDVYYAGTTAETSANFTDIISAVFSDVGFSVPVFTIPGNHEYYSLGYPYFAMLPGLNSSLGSSYLQEASYFCLKVENGGWQFLAMDTGYNDSDPTNAGNFLINGPNLRSDEQQWHWDKLSSFNGTTILLSHHQLFSANAKINGSLSTDGRSNSDYKNVGLYNTFHSFFKNNIAAWIWGHEHSFAVYQNGLEGLAKGRLIGCSAYEEESSLNPYTVNCDDYPYLTDNSHPKGVQVSKSNGYYNHAYAILTIPSDLDANGSINADYYEYPSWGAPTPRPPSPAATPLFSESFTRPSELPQTKVNFNDYIKLTYESNGTPWFLNGADVNYNALLENYPGTLKILSAGSNTGDVDDGNLVYLVSTSPLMNGMYLTSRGTTGELYYAASPGSESIWQLKLVQGTGTSGNSIRMGDSLYITSNAHSGYSINCNSSDILTLTNSTSNRLSFIISSGLSVPQSNLFPSGQTVRLAVAYQNEWYYLAESLLSPDKIPSAGAISMHQIAASGGSGSVEIKLINLTNGGLTEFTYLSTNYSIPRILSNGDGICFETISNSGMGLNGGVYMTGRGTHEPLDLLATEESGPEFTIRKVNTNQFSNSNLDPIITQNDLVYLESNSYPGEYVCVQVFNGNYYLGLSSTPTYCRLDYQELY